MYRQAPVLVCHLPTTLLGFRQHRAVWHCSPFVNYSRWQAGLVRWQAGVLYVQG